MRIVRRLTHVLIIVLTLVVGATAAAVIVSQTAWFKNWLRGYIVREAQQYLNGTLSIERLGGNLFFGVEMENIGVSMDGSQVVAVKDLGLDYNVFELHHQGAVGRQHPPRQAGDLPAARRRHLVAQPARQEAGGRKPIARGPSSRSRSTPSASATDRSSIDEPVGTSRRRGAEAVRSSRCEAVVQVRAGPLLDRDHACVVPRIGAGARAERAVGRRRGEGRHVFVEKLALRTAETSLSVDGAVQHYLTKPVFNLQHQLGQAVAAGDRARSCRRSPACGCSRRSSVKVDGPLDRLGVEMNVRSSAGRLTRQGRRRSSWRPASRSQGDRLGASSGPGAAAERSAAEERHHRGRARRSARRGALERAVRCAGPSPSTRRGSSRPGYSRRAIQRRCADRRPAGRARRQRGGVRRGGDGRTAVSRCPTERQDEPSPSICAAGAQHVDLRRLPRSAGRAAGRHRRQRRLPRRRNGRSRLEPANVRSAIRRRRRSPARGSRRAARLAVTVGRARHRVSSRCDGRRSRSAARRRGVRRRRRSPPTATRARSTATSSASGRGDDGRDDGRDRERHADRFVDLRRHDSAARRSTRRWRATRRT